MDSMYIIDRYKEELGKWFKDLTILVYGSSVYGVSTSDLDVCIIDDNSLTNDDYNRLEYITREFHYKNNLRIDEEVPYKNKLVYDMSFINDTIQNLPFPYENGRYNIPPIQKSHEFLESIQMRKRLLLNILTVKNIIINENGKNIQMYRDAAWEKILKTVISYACMNEFTLDELISCLYADPYTKASGEMYLGYKKNSYEKQVYLRDEVEKRIDVFENNKKLVKTLRNNYIPSERWINR